MQHEALAALTALRAAGDRPADDAYERFLAPARKLLKGSAEYVAVVPGGLDVPGLARSVVQQLGMYADHRQADGDRAGADTLRHEADAITKCYLDEAATAEVRRDRAMLTTYAHCIPGCDQIASQHIGQALHASLLAPRWPAKIRKGAGNSVRMCPRHSGTQLDTAGPEPSGPDQ